MTPRWCYFLCEESAGQKKRAPAGRAGPVKRYFAPEESVVSMACTRRRRNHVDTLDGGHKTPKLNFLFVSFPIRCPRHP